MVPTCKNVTPYVLCWRHAWGDMVACNACELWFHSKYVGLQTMPTSDEQEQLDIALPINGQPDRQG